MSLLRISDLRVSTRASGPVEVCTADLDVEAGARVALVGDGVRQVRAAGHLAP